MGWNLVKNSRTSGSRLKIGDFGVRTCKLTMSLPNHLRGVPLNLYLHDKLLMAKLVAEPKGERKSKSAVNVKELKGFLGEEMAVVYVEEDAVYIGPYEKGEEYLKTCLKKEGVM